MTSQVSETILFNGESRSMPSLPLEQYWDAHPPRPFFIEDSTACSRGYCGEWQIADGLLFLVKLFPAEARATTAEWVSHEDVDSLRSIVRTSLGSEPRILEVLNLLRSPPQGCTAAFARCSRIVGALGEALTRTGDLSDSDPADKLYSAVWEYSAGQVADEVVPVTLDSLFPDHRGAVFAEWFTGALRLPEGKAFPDSGFFVEYEFDRILDVRAGKVIAERLQKNRQSIAREM